MDNGLSFTEVVSRNTGASEEALAIGENFARYIPPPSNDRGLLDAALWWAAYVGKIIPLWPALDERAKEARSDLLGTHWSSDDVASNDLNVVQDWWTAEKFSNIGFVTRGNGILILDLDPRHGGIDRWRALCQRYSIDDSGVPRSTSPRGDGGQHLWFRLPEGETFTHSPLVRGIDRPWQVPVPPSMRVIEIDKEAKDPSRRHGLRPYAWLSGDPRALPLAPPVLYGDQLESSQNVSANGNGPIQPGSPVSLNPDELVAAGGVPTGSQNYTFKRLACSLVRKGKADAEIVPVLLELARKSPVGDKDDPWTEAHMWGIARKARHYIKQQDREEVARQQQAMDWLKKRIMS